MKNIESYYNSYTEAFVNNAARMKSNRSSRILCARGSNIRHTSFERYGISVLNRRCVHVARFRKNKGRGPLNISAIKRSAVEGNKFQPNTRYAFHRLHLCVTLRFSSPPTSLYHSINYHTVPCCATQLINYSCQLTSWYTVAAQRRHMKWTGRNGRRVETV